MPLRHANARTTGASRAGCRHGTTRVLAALLLIFDRHASRSPAAPRRLRPCGAKEIHVTIKITPNDKGNPPGKLADAELHFSDGPFAGLRLIGFAIWERRSGSGRNVTFPARQYNVNGERRSFALLRPITDATAQNKLRELILEAFQEFEERAAIAS
jgi:hypothetical protein